MYKLVNIMGIYELVKYIKRKAIELPMCNYSDFGDLSLYEEKEVLYPLINIDIVNSKVVDNSTKAYTFRIYSMDRNQPYIAYNKCEDLLITLMNQLTITDFTSTFFTLNFKDVINGCYCDVTFTTPIGLECIFSEETGYFILENGDFIKHYLLLEDTGKIELEDK